MAGRGAVATPEVLARTGGAAAGVADAHLRAGARNALPRAPPGVGEAGGGDGRRDPRRLGGASLDRQPAAGRGAEGGGRQSSTGGADPVRNRALVGPVL